MDNIDIRAEYEKAYRAGQREHKSCVAAGLSGYVEVLDEIFEQNHAAATERIGLVEIPTELIVGTKTAGRQFVLSPSFLPLLSYGSEFSIKWTRLCEAHLADQGVQSPIQCFEYYGKFYVQEGNKRVSVFRYFGAPSIPGNVTRILPMDTDSPRYAQYQEFLEWYHITKLYAVQCTQPGGYRKLLLSMGQGDAPWTEEQRRSFLGAFYRFKSALSGQIYTGDLLPGDVLLVFLRYHSFSAITEMDDGALRSAIQGLQSDVRAMAEPNPVAVSTEPTENIPVLNRLFGGNRRLNVAFVHERDAETSSWTRGHELGRRHLQDEFDGRVDSRAYFHSEQNPEAAIQQAVEDGANVIFTTTPPLIAATLRASARYPQVRFLNCSVDMPYPDIRTYYGRVYEGKFITGAIAGAMARDGRIGYVGSYPIFGVPASINAFALGARLVNPEAKIRLEWSCCCSDYMEKFEREGITVISNRDVPDTEQQYDDFGTFQRLPDGSNRMLGSPIWNWGRLYTQVVRTMLDGSWASDQNEAGSRAVNYWWGMESGVIDILLGEDLPEGVRTLAKMLCRDLHAGRLDPFQRLMRDHAGQVRCYGEMPLTVEEILHMDYLCDIVEGEIPDFDRILPMAQRMVRLQGVYRDQIPPEAEVLL